MKTLHSLRWLASATLIGTLAFTTLGVSAQPMPDAGPMMHHATQGKWHEKMLAQWEKHHQALKAKLHLTPAQESAWQTFSEAIKPPTTPPVQAINREDLQRLTTPERIQKMNAFHEARVQEMQTRMKQRSDATLAFYNQLTPEQQKIFDAESLPRTPLFQGGEAKAR